MFEAGTLLTEDIVDAIEAAGIDAVSYTHLRAHETVLDLVCRLLLEKKKTKHRDKTNNSQPHIR